MERREGNSKTASTISALMMIASSLASVAAWYITKHHGYLLAGIGFLIVTPVWYQAPITYSLLKAPVGYSFRNPRRLSRLNQLLSLIGYPMILVGFGLLVIL